MTFRTISVGLSALLLIGSSALWAADNKPQDTDKHMDDAQMKQHCAEMMKNHDMSKMSSADKAMMKRCEQLKQQEEDAKKKPSE